MLMKEINKSGYPELIEKPLGWDIRFIRNFYADLWIPELRV